MEMPLQLLVLVLVLVLVLLRVLLRVLLQVVRSPGRGAREPQHQHRTLISCSHTCRPSCGWSS
jgi:hypothetical protein